MNYLGMVKGHKCNDSGYSEFLVESKLATSDCLAGTLNGKAYATTIFACTTVCEALQRLLMENFIEEVNAEEHNPESLINLVQDCSGEKLDLVTEDVSANVFLQNYLDYEENVRNSHLGKTATFWLIVKDH